jgi:hypothetical protein
VVADDPHDESHYLQLAEQVALRAAAVTDPVTKRELLEIAERFTRLAEYAARRRN